MIFRLQKRHILFSLLLLSSVLFLFAFFADPTRDVLAQPQTRQLPIVMYHHVLKEQRRAGKFVLPLPQMEEDLRYLASLGYTSVTVQDLIDFVGGEKTLPQKIVMLTFDDGYQSVESYVLPLLRETKMKAVLFVVGSYAQTYTDLDDHSIAYANLSWDRLKLLKESGLVELQSHSYNLHSNTGARKGIKKKRGESFETYRQVITKDLLKNQELLQQNTGAAPTAFAYPFGAYSEGTPELLRSLGFQATLTCEERVNTVTEGDAECLFQLGRFNRPAGMDTRAFFQKLGIA